MKRILEEDQNIVLERLVNRINCRKELVVKLIDKKEDE